MKMGRANISRSPSRATDSLLVFWVGPGKMGISAASLKEIRNADGLAPSHSGGAVILSARRFFGVAGGPETHLLVLRGGGVALYVDRVDRMIEAAVRRPLPLAFQGAEREWFRGLALEEDCVIPILNAKAIELAAQALEQEAGLQ